MTERKFLQETNFQDESEVFKTDALDNFAKAYPTDDELPERRAKEQIWRQAAELKPRPVHPNSKSD